MEVIRDTEKEEVFPWFAHKFDETDLKEENDNNNSQDPQEHKGDFGIVRKMIVNHSKMRSHPLLKPGTIVAVKMFKENYEEFYLRNNQIAEVAQEMSCSFLIPHPNLMRCYGFYSGKSKKSVMQTGIVMEYMSEGDLASQLKKNPNWGKGQRLLIAKEIALGMHFLHHMHPTIFHRDLKSDNVLLTKDEKQVLHAKIGEFGQSLNECYETSKSTEVSIPPEIRKHGVEVYSNESDVWQFSTILQDLFPKSENPEITQLISKCNSEDPKDRPSFYSIVNDINKLLKHQDELQIRLCPESLDPFNNAITIEKDNSGRNAMHWWAFYGTFPPTEDLTRSFVNAKDDYGLSPLHFAVRNGHQHILDLLLEKGASANCKDFYGNTPLHYAIEFRYPFLLDALIVRPPNQVANVNEKNEKGQPPLFVAIYCDDEAAAQTLIKCHCDINARDNDGWTAMLLIAKVGCNASIADFCAQNKVDINARQTTKKNSTPLHWAAALDRVEIIQVLLQYEADIDALTSDNESALFWAAEANALDAVMLLMDGGANFQADQLAGNQSNPLLIARASNSVDVVQWFIEELGMQ